MARGRQQPGSKYAGFVQSLDAVQKQPEVDVPMSMDELRVLVSRAARRGSVPAMSLLWRMLRSDRDRTQKQPADPLEFADELAARRSGRPPEAS